MPPSPALALEAFARTHINAVLKAAEESGGECAPAAAQTKLLHLFRSAAAAVPAYAEFLKEQEQQQQQEEQAEEDLAAAAAGAAEEIAAEPPEALRQQAGGAGPAAAVGSSPGDLGPIPFTTKENYYHRFPLPRRCAGGTLAAADFVHCSSGSSGQPTHWARNAFDVLEVCARFEQVFRDNFSAHARTTLAVVALPLGVWVGGIFTTQCANLLSTKGYHITTVTPGNKAPDILQVVQSLGPHYDQTVLLGYPPYLKEVVDAGIAQGVDWGRYRVKMVLAGEVFSEEWRDLIVKRCGMGDVLRDVVSIYGTADAGVIANETALSVAVRRWLAQHPEAARALFGKDRLPTLVQYDPCSRFLELHPKDGTLVVSAVGTPNTAAPLLRYCIGDAGGIMGHAQMLGWLQARGFALPAGISIRRLPFAWVFGRSFWTVSLFGANVFVENIMSGLEQPSVHGFVTGKFVLYVHEDTDLNKQLGLRVELARGIEPSDAVREAVGAAVLGELLRLNSEYRNYVPPDRQPPLVTLHPAGDALWFSSAGKHKYTL